MAFEILVGVNVINEDSYNTYREKMKPILSNHGGDFIYDFKIAEVLKSEVDNPINRVFTLLFKDKNSKEAFFSDEEYKKVKEEHFTQAVSVSTYIAEYEKN